MVGLLVFDSIIVFFDPFFFTHKVIIIFAYDEATIFASTSHNNPSPSLNPHVNLKYRPSQTIKNYERERERCRERVRERSTKVLQVFCWGLHLSWSNGVGQISIHLYFFRKFNTCMPLNSYKQPNMLNLLTYSGVPLSL